jgi:hypothetical protein
MLLVSHVACSSFMSCIDPVRAAEEDTVSLSLDNGRMETILVLTVLGRQAQMSIESSDVEVWVVHYCPVGSYTCSFWPC